ncbi:excinuclease ABC subunit UvrC [Moheibacter sediminis]|uniref:UvrABC system protein C n=1 Tax=Moheibacter sediminis TaxID=1434700 RepID=A0A1W2BPW4_9FLAO|nr:excinuclease ABC subunit UvrC [Moheibacter sediminis]SMC74891.1 Excinuclease ABC subunit C [Moheibacter sediminis]
MQENLKLILQTLPDNPGVYQYYDKNGKILYVGKAKNLKKRVSSYFNKIHDSGKTRVMVSKIADIQTIIVETEFDALLLENNLIKKYLPKYNILLKDDKTYPWICIKNEPFPRIFKTRKVIKDGSEYFGPYASVTILQALLGLIREIYPLRTCNYDLSPKNIESGKYKVCLEYHIGNCLGPCEGYQAEENYDANIESIRNIIKGNYNDAIRFMTRLMNEFAEKLDFETAQSIKEKIDLVKNYQVKSTVVNPTIKNVDVFTIISDESAAYVNFLRVNNGAIIQSHTLELKKKLDESNEELLESAIVEILNRFGNHSREIYLPFNLDFEIPNVKISVPQIGDKKRLLDLSERNAKYFRLEQMKQMKILDPDRHTKRIMAQMQKDLRMPAEPRHIEGFDNSNIQGTNPVSACVVFKDGKPSKKDYRIFNVKTVEGPDDFATMEEVIYRRYKRVLEEEGELPQLILIDGGKGQLSSALKSIDKLGLRGKITIIGIAKRLEEIFFPGDSIPLYLDKSSETLKVLQHIRNESHRFGITKHRARRSKNSFNSELEGIPGIGDKTIQDLLNKFKSVKRIKSASKEELAEIVGSSRAEKIIEFFKN